MDKAANTDALDTYSKIDVDPDSKTDVEDTAAYTDAVDTYSNIDVNPDSNY